MATQTVCDHPLRGGICGEIVETSLEIAIGGKSYALELCDRHQKPARDLIEVGGTRRRSSNGSVKKSTKASPKRRRKATDHEVREWAMAHGVEVSTTGRVPKAVKEQFLASV